jgi:superfamily II DNA/RNA helicase
MNFSELLTHPRLLKAIEIAGYTTPTPIQQQAIPAIMGGHDIRASSRTGSGKTAAFLLPSLQRLTSAPVTPGRGPRLLILVPTRELAMQVAAEAQKYSAYLQKTRTVCIYGGVPYPVQNRELSRPYEILVATPGRLLDFLSQKRICLSRVETLILDEADRMLDMGFIEPVEEIAAHTATARQTLLFSATLKGAVLDLSRRLLRNPVEIHIEAAEETFDSIEQRLHYVDDLQHKYNLLEHVLTDRAIQQAIVFIATKHHADELAEKLCELGHKAAPLHGDMNQRQRTRTLRRMREGEIRVLVATDVAARGIDVQTITHVINFDLPMSPEDYVHRIGRTGRAGAKGVALSFASPKDKAMVDHIERFTKHKLQSCTIPGLEPRKTVHRDRRRPAPYQHRTKPHYRRGKKECTIS